MLFLCVCSVVLFVSHAFDVSLFHAILCAIYVYTVWRPCSELPGLLVLPSVFLLQATLLVCSIVYNAKHTRSHDLFLFSAYLIPWISQWKCSNPALLEFLYLVSPSYSFYFQAPILTPCKGLAIISTPLCRCCTASSTISSPLAGQERSGVCCRDVASP